MKLPPRRAASHGDHLTPLQEAALGYLEAGLHLLALTGKRPNPQFHADGWSWDDSFHGSPATEEEWEAIGAAFSERRGTTGIAILIPGGMLVADVDSDRAAALLLELGWEHGEDSIIARTKNGLHVWFVAPGEERNRWVGDGQQPDPTRTLLFKGLGGYVVAPPSLHFDASGAIDGTYEWVSPLVSEGRARFPDIIPEGVRTRFKLDDQYGEKPKGEQMAHFTMEAVEGVPWYRWPVTWHYATEGLERAIETAADGNQNNVIHWAAMTANEEGVPFDVAYERLMAAAQRGGHPRNRARDTIRGAYKRRGRG